MSQSSPMTFAVQASGSVYLHGVWDDSDSTKKENIKNISGSLKKIMEITPVHYNYKSDKVNSFNKTGSDLDEFLETGTFLDSILDPNFLKDEIAEEVGVLAQEIAEILPTAVQTGPDGTLYVSYNQLTVLAISAIKELNAKVEYNDSIATNKITVLETEFAEYRSNNNSKIDSLILFQI